MMEGTVDLDKMRRELDVLKEKYTKVIKRNYTGHELKASYNDLPTPQGSWQTHYDAAQRKYNMQLAFGIVFTIGTLVFARAGGFMNLNYSPPEKPAED